jgi:hypothetical protein
MKAQILAKAAITSVGSPPTTAFNATEKPDADTRSVPGSHESRSNMV